MKCEPGFRSLFHFKSAVIINERERYNTNKAESKSFFTFTSRIGSRDSDRTSVNVFVYYMIILLL